MFWRIVTFLQELWLGPCAWPSWSLLPHEALPLLLSNNKFSINLVCFCLALCRNCTFSNSSPKMAWIKSHWNEYFFIGYALKVWKDSWGKHSFSGCHVGCGSKYTCLYCIVYKAGLFFICSFELQDVWLPWICDHEAMLDSGCLPFASFNVI